MRGPFKSRISIVIMALLLAGLLAACGSGGDSAPASGDAGSASAPAGGASAPSSGTEKKPEDYAGTVTLWGWDQNYYETTFAEFNKVYPNIKLEYTNVAADDYLQKLQTTIAAAGELPDLLVAEINWRGRAFKFDIWENLEAAPYNYDRSLSFDYLPPLTSNAKGEIIGIEQTVTPAALAYRRDLAKTYLGTDDPRELAAMLPTWEAMVEKGREVLDKSDGNVYMMPGLFDVHQVLAGQNKVPLMDGDTLNVTGRYLPVLETLVSVRDSGIIDKLEMWSPQWNASYAGGQHIFFAAANWSPQFVVKPNDKDGEGRWGLMVAPGGPYTWGGTVYGINKDSKNKELAWKYIEWLLLTKEGAEVSKSLNFFVPLKSAYEDEAFTSFVDPFFAGQDVGKFWMEEITPHIDVPQISEYDWTVNESMNLILSYLNADRSATAEDALARLIQEVKAKLPDANVK